jgi:hypothetical protein
MNPAAENRRCHSTQALGKIESMLRIQINMNSNVEEVLAFKTCCGMKMFDQNLEFLVTNQGASSVTLSGFIDLMTPQGSQRINALMPPGEQNIPPGEVRAFYCSMMETLWRSVNQVVFYDTTGVSYPTQVDHTEPKI